MKPARHCRRYELDGLRTRLRNPGHDRYSTHYMMPLFPLVCSQAVIQPASKNVAKAGPQGTARKQFGECSTELSSSGREGNGWSNGYQSRSARLLSHLLENYRDTTSPAPL